MPLLYGLCASLLVVLGALSLRMLRSQSLAESTLIAADTGEESEHNRGWVGPLIDWLGAKFQRRLMLLYGQRRLLTLDQRLGRAGRPENLTVSLFMQRQAGFTIIGIVCGVLFWLMGQPVLGILVAGLFSVWMSVWLRAVASNRRAAVSRELPDFLDVLGVTVRAGLSFQQAIERVCEFHDGPLGEEMSIAIDEMAVGVSRRDALIGVRDRTQSETVATFVTTLLQGAELGVPIAEALSDISLEVRRRRAQEVRQAAAKAAPKVSLVVTMTIVPGALLLMMAGLIMANLETFTSVFG